MHWRSSITVRLKADTLSDTVRLKADTTYDDVRGASEDAVVVIGADTAVVVDGEILGKPRDAADAERMIRRLSGRRHEVMTGVSVRCGGPRARRC